MLQRELGLSEDTIAFDLNAACSGFLYATHTMECLLATAKRKIGLVVGAEVLSNYLDFDDRSTCVLFGDGAGAAIVESRPEWGSVHAQLGARGDWDVLGVANPFEENPNRAHMNGKEVFKFAVTQVPKCMDDVLAAAGKTLDDVDYVVLHQANERIVDHIVKKYNIPQEKCKKNMDRYGNTSAASVPILLSEMSQNGDIKPGDLLLCVGFGAGLTWGGALIEMGEKR